MLMIHQCYFQASQRERTFQSPLYKGFGLYEAVNPDIARNCPELVNPSHQPLLSEYCAMLHLWRNPDLDPDSWIGFTSYRQLEKVPTILHDRALVESTLLSHDVLGWGGISFYDVGKRKPMTMAEQGERCHPGITSCLYRLLLLQNDSMPAHYISDHTGFYSNYWIMSKANFNNFMDWSSPLVRWCLTHSDHFVQSHPRSIAYLVERLFICWYALKNKQLFHLGPIQKVAFSGGAPTLEPEGESDSLITLRTWQATVYELCQRHGYHPQGIIHVGAHYGQERDVYRQLGVENVLWIEADPRHQDTLKANLAPYAGQRCLQACLSNVDGQDTSFFRTNNRGESSSILPIGSHQQHFPDIRVVEETTLKTITLAKLAQQENIDLQVFDFLVIDVQGAELLVLKGFKEQLQRINGLYLEVNLEQLYQGCALLPDLDAYLKPFGFHRRETLLTNQKYGDALYLRAGRFRESPIDLALQVAQSRDQLTLKRAFVLYQNAMPVRRVEILQYGQIGEGKTQHEQGWIMRGSGSDVLLEFVSVHGRSMCLRRIKVNHWRGSSTLYPGQTLELLPQDVPGPNSGFPQGSNAPLVLIEALRDALSLRHCVETGTYRGVTAAEMASRFPHVSTIELDPKLFRETSTRLQTIPHIHCYHGDSVRELPGILGKLNGPALFWLDGHWSAGETSRGEIECPVLEELALIYGHRSDHVVLVDDARLFLAPPPPPHQPEHWPTYTALCDFLLRRVPMPYFRLIGDVLVAVPQQAAPVIHEYCREYGIVQP